MKFNKKTYFSLAAVLVVALVAGNVLIKSPGGKANAEMRSNLSEDMNIPVSTVALEKGQLEDTIFAVGSVEPSATYEVNAKVNGEVDKVFVTVGETVKEGDVLFTMKDDAFASDKVSKTQSLKNQMDLAKISYDQATKSYNNTKILFEAGSVSTDQLDQSELSYKNAKASYENARLSYNATLSSLGDQTDFYTVKSPVSGLVTGRNIEEGMFASNQNGVTIIVDDSLKIDATVASKYISQVSVGQSVDIYVNTLEKNYKGELVSISYAAQKGSYPVEVMFTEADETIYTGMFAELEIEIASREDILLIPIDALVKEGNQTYVFKVVDGLAVKTVVETGIRSSVAIEASSGDLAEGDLLVLEGKEFLKDGVKVMVK